MCQILRPVTKQGTRTRGLPLSCTTFQAPGIASWHGSVATTTRANRLLATGCLLRRLRCGRREAWTFLVVFQASCLLEVSHSDNEKTMVWRHLGLGLLLLHAADKAQSQQCQLGWHRWLRCQVSHGLYIMLKPEPWQNLAGTQNKVCCLPTMLPI